MSMDALNFGMGISVMHGLRLTAQREHTEQGAGGRAFAAAEPARAAAAARPRAAGGLGRAVGLHHRARR